VGDALVAQIPALLISVAAAMVVSRVGKEQDVGSQIAARCSTRRARWPWRRASSAARPDPGHAQPGVPGDRRGAGLGPGGCATREGRPSRQDRCARPKRAQANPEATWDDLTPVDTLGLEVGYRLITLVDKARAGDLLGRIKGVRKKFAQDVGFLPPPVHIRDNLELKPSTYRVTLRGAVVGEGEAFPGMFLAINPGGATHQLPGTRTTDPAFGLPAVWIEERQRERPK
jgi:flagellar biosynthesis protein FlhA